MNRLRIALWVVASMASMVARAELKLAAPDGLLVEHRYEAKASLEQTWAALIRPQAWWPSDHTWSGSAANLSLRPEAGGCFCEHWPQGSAEHGRVVMAQPQQMLRIVGALGPLQDMAVNAVLTIRLAAVGDATQIVVTYRVGGTAAHRLQELSGVIDQVVGGQFSGLTAVAEQNTALR